MFRLVAPLLFVLAISVPCFAQSVDSSPAPLPPGANSDEMRNRTVVDERSRRYVLPKKILWKSESGVENAESILLPVLGQTANSPIKNGFLMTAPASILLDFGVEIHGGIRIDTRNLLPGTNTNGRTAQIRIRFGESADEAMAEMGEKGACNDHSTRDLTVPVPWLGGIEVGETAFRFVRLDVLDSGEKIWFDSIRAVFTYRDIPWVGEFRSSDERLNAIWKTAAHTQHLTMQGYIFEGAKRDRLVWFGDFHPQLMTTLHVFGTPKVLRDTLGYFARETTPLPQWMNGMPNYSLWWLVSVSDMYRYSGNIDDLKTQHEYIKGLIAQLAKHVKPNGEGAFESPFLDWPTQSNRPAVNAGTHAMFAIAFDRVTEIAKVLNDSVLEKQATALAAKVRTFKPDNVGNKQAAALLALAGIERAEKPNIPVICEGKAKGFSTFYGYYMLEALAQGNENQTAIDVIRNYWGAMLDVGATTFWEDFDLAWLDGAGRIDEITPLGKKSLHGDYGAYCYVGFRHSLCHGWASGPAAWMSRHLLGVTPVEPGFKTVNIEPFLGDLDWVEGAVPTPFGPIKVRHEKQSDGSIKSNVQLPTGVTAVKKTMQE